MGVFTGGARLTLSSSLRFADRSDPRSRIVNPFVSGGNPSFVGTAFPFDRP